MCVWLGIHVVVCVGVCMLVAVCLVVCSYVCMCVRMKDTRMINAMQCLAICMFFFSMYVKDAHRL